MYGRSTVEDPEPRRAAPHVRNVDPLTPMWFFKTQNAFTVFKKRD
jgi:hypothetical protein